MVANTLYKALGHYFCTVATTVDFISNNQDVTETQIFSFNLLGLSKRYCISCLVIAAIYIHRLFQF